MLFSFNNFWKSIVVLVLTWIIYTIWGFEFTVISLLALILAKNN